MKKYVMEFIGTFFLVLTIGLTASNTSLGPFVPLVIGSVLVVMIYAGGALSGAHYNPAVTLAACLSKKTTVTDSFYYVVSQILAAIAATTVVSFIGQPITSVFTVSTVPTFIAELIFTFALVFVILMVACSNRTKGNSYFGAAIGLTVMVGAYTVGAISGAVFNPAVMIGLILLNILPVSVSAVYLSSHIIASLIAWKTFEYLES
jgi:aquaporin Z